MIGSGGLLLVVPTYMQFQLQFHWELPQKTAKLRHLILLSRVDILNTGGDALIKQQSLVS
jgi:hypothetical protein